MSTFSAGKELRRREGTTAAARERTRNKKGVAIKILSESRRARESDDDQRQREEDFSPFLFAALVNNQQIRRGEIMLSG